MTSNSISTPYERLRNTISVSGIIKPVEQVRPSNKNIKQMVEIANSFDYNTPKSVLIVVGGSEWEVVAYVYPRHGSPVKLMAREP